MVALNLGGSARISANEIDPNVFQNGQQELGPNGQFIHVPGLAILLRHLTQRFAPLADESSMKGITDLMSFGRMPSESIDSALVRFETCLDRARNLSNFTLSFPGQSWLLLSAFRVPMNMWTQLLAPTQGNLPQTAAEYATMLSYLRRQGHLLEGGHMSLHAPSRQGPTYHAYPVMDGNAASSSSSPPGMFTGAPFPGSMDDAAAYPSMPGHSASTGCCPTCGRGDGQFHVDDDACSTDTEDDLSVYQIDADIARLPVHDQLDEAYFKYRKSKHTWRKLAGRPTRRFRKFQRRGPRYMTEAYMRRDNNQPRRNPKGKDGQVMKCHGCNSEFHLKRDCPQAQAAHAVGQTTVAGAVHHTSYHTQSVHEGPLGVVMERSSTTSSMHFMAISAEDANGVVGESGRSSQGLGLV